MPRPTPQQRRVPPWLSNGLAVLVSFVWAGSFVLGAVRPGYSADPAVHGAFVIVLGAVYGVKIGKGNE